MCLRVMTVKDMMRALLAYHCCVAGGMVQQDCRAGVGTHPDGDSTTPGVLIVVHLLTLLNICPDLIPAAGNSSVVLSWSIHTATGYSLPRSLSCITILNIAIPYL